MTNRIDRIFRQLRTKRKKAFIAFITAGYPDLKTTAELVLAFSRAGVDIIELGVPFSDPMADGPIIQEASQQALKKKVTLGAILRMVEALRKKTGIPICLMTYYNPIFCFNEARFVKAAVACGVDGVIVPDLPPEEAGDFRRLAAKMNLATVLFIAPTTTASRARLIARMSRGFIYYVSLTGVTGPRQALPADLKAHVRAIKKITDKPVCVGFGISTPQQVAQIQKISDGAIVGSAIVGKIKKNLGRPDLVKRVSDFVRVLCTGKKN
ncbi:MAG TPA: tryptophan synthase subunit alpha [Patescibacteria group bacterium]|nr:tryptophan synthase subunit alpha [Patescibacteria group bacterium]